MAEKKGVLSVMMPAYNEAGTIAQAIDRVLARPEVGELIVVDDASTDDTWKILTELMTREPRVRAVRQPQNQGKGAAIRRAIKELRRPYAIVQDADLEVDPQEYESLLEPLLDGRADAVFGSRNFPVTNFRSLVFTLGTGLSKLEHDALKLYLEGSSYEEMAERLGCDTKTIDNALQRVKRKVLTHQASRQVLQ